MITAAATLATLDLGGDGEGEGRGDAPSAALPRGTSAAGTTRGIGAPAQDQPGCFGRYFGGVPSDRIRPVEEGTHDFDVVSAAQPKAGTIGLRFTDGNEPVGAMRIAFYPDNALFKIESVVDARCRPIDEYANVTRGGDKQVLQNWDTVRMELGAGFYDLRIGASTTVRLSFQAYAP